MSQSIVLDSALLMPSTSTCIAAGVGGLDSSTVAGVGGLVVLSIACGEVGASSMGSGWIVLLKSGNSGRSKTTSFCDTKEFMMGMCMGPMGATMGVSTGPGRFGQIVPEPELFSTFFGVCGGGLTRPDEDTLVQGSGRLTLEVVAVEVMQVFTLGCNIPMGFNPTWGLVSGPHIDLVFCHSGNQAVTADLRA